MRYVCELEFADWRDAETFADTVTDALAFRWYDDWYFAATYRTLAAAQALAARAKSEYGDKVTTMVGPRA